MRHEFSDEQKGPNLSFATTSKQDGARERLCVWGQTGFCVRLMRPHSCTP
jgi:hypothetical protein